MREALNTVANDFVRFGGIAMAIAACGGEFTGDAGAPDASSAGGSSGSAGGAKASGGGSSDAASRGAGGTSNSGGSSGKGGSSGGMTGGSSGSSSGGTSGAMTGGSSGTGKGGSSGSSSGSSGSGGVAGTGSGGVATGGAGGATACAPGALECDAQPPQRCGVDGRWQQTTCGPLRAADVTAMNTSGLPGFNVGFRCKTVTVCTVNQDCVYFSQNLGVMQSSEMTYYDGAELAQPEQVRVRIAVGAASQCMDPVITLTAGEKLTVQHDGQIHTIYFPSVSTRAVTLFVREDGATFFDAALTSLAQPPP